MNSVVLIPYCPIPLDTGGKAEMWKHLNVLRELGSCRIVTARRRPVGLGWTADYEREIRSKGFDLVFREDCSGLTGGQMLGFLYGLIGKGLGMERAFGHSNPYHRYAFSQKWWINQTNHADVAVINYSYWARLPCRCPKVVVLLDLWSDFMWEGPRRETKELKTADMVVAISKHEEEELRKRGVQNILWSPPAIAAARLPDSARIGMIGSPSKLNREGLRWLSMAAERAGLPIRVYGGIAEHAAGNGFQPIGRYADMREPYRECGIILITTALGMGVQIKAIEALAAGRAIIARRGAMRGIPGSKPGWIEVSNPREMLGWAKQLKTDRQLRDYWSSRAKEYYRVHLESGRILSDLKTVYTHLGS